MCVIRLNILCRNCAAMHSGCESKDRLAIGEDLKHLFCCSVSLAKFMTGTCDLLQSESVNPHTVLRRIAKSSEAQRCVLGKFCTCAQATTIVREG